MMSFEVTLLCVSVLCGLFLIWSGSRLRPVSVPSILIVLIILFALHLAFEQIRWLMLPVYMIAVVVGASAYLLNRRSQHKSARKRKWSIGFSLLASLAALLSFCTASMMPLFQFAKPNGPFHVGVQDFTWSDQERFLADGTPRQINARIWYPSNGEITTTASYVPQTHHFVKAVKKEHGLWAQLLRDFHKINIPAQYAPGFAQQLNSAPVVIYLHGNQSGTRFTGTFQALELASHGYVVVALEHPGTAFISVFDEARYTAFSNEFAGLPEVFGTHNAVAIPIIQEMQADVQFALRYLSQMEQHEPQSAFLHHLDLDRVALIGHSFGGAAAAHILANTPIAKVAVNLDGYLYGDYPSEPMDKPLLILNGDLPINGLEETMSGLEDERAIRDRLLSNKGYEVTLPEAGHLNFTDLPLYSPLLKTLAPDAKEQHRLINAHTLRFLQDHL